jgi:hypothetical protein
MKIYLMYQQVSTVRPAKNGQYASMKIHGIRKIDLGIRKTH